MHAYTTSVVEPSALSSAVRAEFTDELYAAHSRIFTGIDRAEFTSYVVDSPADETRIHVLRDPDGVIRGYTALHIFLKSYNGEDRVIVRLESGYESDYRRRNVQGTFLITEVLKICLRFRKARKYFLCCFVHPSAYIALRRHTQEIWPCKEQTTPMDTQVFMNWLARDFSLAPINDQHGVYQVGWITRESRRENRVWRQRVDADAIFFVENNPDYKAGQGLLTLIPLHFPGLIHGTMLFLNRSLRRVRPVATAQSSPQAS